MRHLPFAVTGSFRPGSPFCLFTQHTRSHSPPTAFELLEQGLNRVKVNIALRREPDVRPIPSLIDVRASDKPVERLHLLSLSQRKARGRFFCVGNPRLPGTPPWLAAAKPAATSCVPGTVPLRGSLRTRPALTWARQLPSSSPDPHTVNLLESPCCRFETASGDLTRSDTMVLSKGLSFIVILSVLGVASASSFRRSLMQAAPAPAPSIPTSGTELLCYQNIGNSTCCGYSPGLPNGECQQYSGAVLGQDFVSYKSGCIWPLAVQCSLITPLTNTTVSLTRWCTSVNDAALAMRLPASTSQSLAAA